MERHFHLHEHLHAGAQGAARRALKMARHEGIDVAPDAPGGFGQQAAVGFALLHKFQVAMARSSRAHLAQLGHEPEGFGQRGFERGAYQAVQFVQRKRAAFHYFFISF